MIVVVVVVVGVEAVVEVVVVVVVGEADEVEELVPLPKVGVRECDLLCLPGVLAEQRFVGVSQLAVADPDGLDQARRRLGGVRSAAVDVRRRLGICRGGSG